MDTLTYEEQFQRARAIAIETDRYAEQDEEQRDKWLNDALNNSWHDGIMLNDWLRRAGYVREGRDVDELRQFLAGKTIDELPRI